MKTIVPDYYPKFHCKCGECRHTCCNGWNITLSYLEYCKLLGVDCSSELRQKLDCAFFRLKDSTNERYSAVNRNYLDNCPLLREDGFCALQCECGEETLPLICRMYPRNITCADWGEGACATSCERVVELLMEETEGLRFVETELERKSTPEESNIQQQKEFLSCMQNRSLSLQGRLLKAGSLFGFFHGKYASTDIFSTFFSLIDALESYSPNFEKISIETKNERDNVFRSEEERERRYFMALHTFRKHFPLSEIWLENIFINHLFFEEFPHFCHGNDLFEKYTGQCVLFCILQFLCVSYTEEREKDTDFVDCVASVFRCFEHSDADRVVLDVLKEKGKLSDSFLHSLLVKTA